MNAQEADDNPDGAGRRFLNLPPPKSFDGTPEAWPKWRQRFDRYKTTTGLSLRPRAEQVSTFLYSMGEVADDILTTLDVDEDTITYEGLVDKFNEHFGACKNTIIARAKFNKRVQKPGEQVDFFIQDLHKLAEDCDYGILKEELIRDRIVVGVIDDNLSNDLQARAQLTYNEAMQLSRQAEARKNNQSVLRHNSAVDFVRQKKKGNGPQLATRIPQYARSKGQAQSNSKKCKYCGREFHTRDKCPARNATCRKCSKRGHYQNVCHSACQERRDTRVQQIDSDSGEDFLGSLHDSHDDYWSADIKVNSFPCNFKLDTGASVSVMTSTEGLLKCVKLQNSSKTLRGPGGSTINPSAEFVATLEYHGRKINEKIYVLDQQPCSLLSRSACVQLGLLSRVDSITTVPDFKAEFPSVFEGLGLINKECKISLREDAQPLCLYTARKVAHPLLDKVKKELQRMETQGVISPVTEPSEWCSGMVVVPKPSGAIRICVDLTQLNAAVQREVHPMASVDDSLAKLSGSKVFTKLDAKSGFWQIPLHPDSRRLTTFITPFGRYCFNRLPFGISSAPEIFQRTMSEILIDLPGVVCHTDDILIHAAEQETHNQRVRAVLRRLQEAGVTLNEKCEFSKPYIKFLGHIVDADGIHVDPKKVEAIQDFPVPTTVTELQRFFGMVNQLAKFTPDLAKVNAPLRQLLQKNTAWRWDAAQQSAFEQIKTLLLSPPVLAHYSPQADTFIAADASSTGIGAVLSQGQQDGSRRPICYISRSLSDAEKNYATIEKEALAATWACERFNEYVLGLPFTLETDHKPLIPLLSKTELWKMPPRIQRFRLRMMRYSPKIVHVPGKQQVTADALSRAPVSKPDSKDMDFVNQVAALERQTIDILPASTGRLQEIREAQKEDGELHQVREYCVVGWPAYMPENPLLKQYWLSREHLTMIDDLLLFDDRLVIPRSLRMDILNRLHEGHLGITKCRSMARTSVWWPYISAAIEEMVNKCSTCAKHQPEQKEPLLPSSFPDRPWERIGMDLFELHGKMYLSVVDYYSRWVETKLLTKQTSAETINQVKSIFAVHGIPDVVVTDNGPQFSSEEFSTFARTYGFTHVTSSPIYPQSNGQAERTVRTVKLLLKKSKDPYLALLMYRATPLQNGLSPSELLMGRKLKTRVPVLPSTLNPATQDHSTIRDKEATYRERQCQNYDHRHMARDLPRLQPGDQVWIRDMKRQGEVISRSKYPRSYVVKTAKGTVRRNRAAMVSIPSMENSAVPHCPKPVTQSKPVTPSKPTPPRPSPKAFTPKPLPRASFQSSPVQSQTQGTVESRPQPIPSNEQCTTTRSGRSVVKPIKLDL